MDGTERYEWERKWQVRHGKRPEPGSLVWVHDGWDTRGERAWVTGIYIDRGEYKDYSTVLLPPGKLEDKRNVWVMVRNPMGTDDETR